eukprot:RCo011420
MHICLWILLSLMGSCWCDTTPDLGILADLKGKQIFPSNNPWNTPINNLPVDPNSAIFIQHLGGSNTKFHPDFGANWNGGPFGIPYIVVPGNQTKFNVTFTYSDESDKGPYPLPSNIPIEGGATSTGDRHAIALDRDNWRLYELYNAFPPSGSTGWKADSGAIFDLNSNVLRPAGWTSADAAGLPILPGLVRYDEVVLRKQITHALRFTAAKTQKAYVSPARHYASTIKDPTYLPMGARLRLKASYDISKFPADAQVILTALKVYGLILADNGSNLYVSGTPDSRWNDNNMNKLKVLTAANFEVVQLGPVTKGY